MSEVPRCSWERREGGEMWCGVCAHHHSPQQSPTSPKVRSEGEGSVLAIPHHHHPHWTLGGSTRYPLTHSSPGQSHQLTFILCCTTADMFSIPRKLSAVTEPNSTSSSPAHRPWRRKRKVKQMKESIGVSFCTHSIGSR